jgi:hypothetical protein
MSETKRGSDVSSESGLVRFVGGAKHLVCGLSGIVAVLDSGQMLIELSQGSISSEAAHRAQSDSLIMLGMLAAAHVAHRIASSES